MMLTSLFCNAVGCSEDFARKRNVMVSSFAGVPANLGLRSSVSESPFFQSFSTYGPAETIGLLTKAFAQASTPLAFAMCAGGIGLENSDAYSAIGFVNVA